VKIVIDKLDININDPRQAKIGQELLNVLYANGINMNGVVIMFLKDDAVVLV